MERLWLSPPLNTNGDCDAVVFSGGVSEYVYGNETASYDDLGAPLGRALRRRIDDGALPAGLVSARECIRATVMGAAQHTVQVSRQHHIPLRRRTVAAQEPPGATAAGGF